MRSLCFSVYVIYNAAYYLLYYEHSLFIDDVKWAYFCYLNKLCFLKMFDFFIFWLFLILDFNRITEDHYLVLLRYEKDIKCFIDFGMSYLLKSMLAEDWKKMNENHVAYSLIDKIWSKSFV